MNKKLIVEDIQRMRFMFEYEPGKVISEQKSTSDQQLLTTLLLEVSLEDIKSHFVDTNKISQNDFEEIISAVGNKTSYATWLAKKVANNIIKGEDIYKFKKYFSIFSRQKKKYPSSDINSYKSAEDVVTFIKKSIEIADEEKTDPSKQKGVSRSDKYKEFYMGSVDGFDVYELPQGRNDLYGASCELGSGTEWCTATGKNRKYFDEHIQSGPLFIFIKPGSDEKYQFSYETIQFMDKHDNSIFNSETNLYNLFDFIETNRPEYKIPLTVKLRYYPESITKDDLNVKGDLDFDFKTPFTSLPDNLTVGGYLGLTNTPITSLPDNLTVEDHLFLSNTPITTLPNNLRVGGMLNLRHTPLSKQYSEDEIRKMIQDRGGDVEGEIYV